MTGREQMKQSVECGRDSGTRVREQQAIDSRQRAVEHHPTQAFSRRTRQFNLKFAEFEVFLLLRPGSLFALSPSSSQRPISAAHTIQFDQRRRGRAGKGGIISDFSVLAGGIGDATDINGRG